MSADTPVTQQSCEPPTLASTVPGRDQHPQLGNFSRILASSVVDWALYQSDVSVETENHSSIFDDDEEEEKSEARADLKLGTCTGLGDFRRVFNQFQSLVSFENGPIDISSLLPNPVATECVSSACPGLVCHINHVETPALSSTQSQSNPIHLSGSTRLNSSVKNTPFTILKRPVSSRPLAQDVLSSSDLDFKSDFDHCLKLEPPIITPASTPPSPQPKDLISANKIVSGKVGKTKTRSKSRNGILLSYHLGKDSPAIHIYGRIHTPEQKHEALMMELTPNRILDAATAKKYPKVVSHGIHVFVDMSNIDIGFQKALRVRHGLGDNAHFSPLPHLNLEFLNEVLIRGRTAVTRSVGCSVVPGRPEPRYIQELQSLGYHVDLRERKPISDARNASSLSVRYVEDLVDETLQTRIAESVMEYFQRQGTIILATGDAKPAQYSDGFFAYAERALRMGWHIELASWKGSLSSSWTSRKWKAQWGNRFRIVELDDFLDNILAFDP